MDPVSRKQSDTSTSNRFSNDDNKYHSNVSRTTSSPFPKTLSDFEESNKTNVNKKYSSSKGPSSSSSSITTTKQKHQSSIKSGSNISVQGRLRKGGSVDIHEVPLSPADKERQRLLEIKRDEAVIRERELLKLDIYEMKRKQKITMLGFSIGCFITGILWIVIISIDYWYHVHGLQNNIHHTNNKTNSSNSNGTEETHGKFIKSNGGLWRVCRTEVFEHKDNNNNKETTFCQEHGFFLSEDELEERKEIDEHVIDYLRTELSFTVMSLILLPMSVFASFYAAKNSRYMYKRLASCLYFLLCSTVLIVIEVLITRVNYEKDNIPYLHPKNSEDRYGFCLYTSWIIFLIFLVTAILFLVYSRKRKGDKAIDDEDEGQIMGR